MNVNPTSATAGVPIRILLVEDNAGDALLTTEALAMSSVPTSVTVRTTAEDALEWLQLGNPVDIIILDVNLPGMTGLELLEHLKGAPRFKVIPVIMLSTSKRDIDVLASYDRYASSYVTKPIGLDDFSEVMRSIEQFWLGTVQLPVR